MSPVAAADGHDAPVLVAKAVPCLAAEGDDLVVGLEDAVRQPVVAHGVTVSNGHPAQS